MTSMDESNKAIDCDITNPTVEAKGAMIDLGMKVPNYPDVSTTGPIIIDTPVEIVEVKKQYNKTKKKAKRNKQKKSRRKNR